MKNEKNVIINGKKYDSATGLLIASPKFSPKIDNIKKSTNPTILRSLAQKSKIIYDRTIKNPVGHIISTRKIGHNMDIARSKGVSHFAPHTTTVSTKPTIAKQQIDIAPVRHPLVERVDKIRSLAKNTPTKTNIIKTPKAVKEEAIAEALKKVPEKQKKISIFKRKRKFINFFSISIVLLIVLSLFIYLNMPSISVRVASAQAGINATYPEYHPDGYSLSGPISYGDGEVTINFRANTGNSKFTIKQSRSSWDSSAVENKVKTDSNNEFITTKERGLTIYTYNGNAAWVNGGILYSISGDAPLSGDQIRRIATSL